MGPTSTGRNGRQISQFFVYGLTSSGGHSPWRHPIGVYSRKQKRFARVDDMIGGPIVSEQFQFIGPHTLTATARIYGKAEDNPPPEVTIRIDLEEGFEKLPPE
jgi:hypothetical protein